MFTPRLNLLLIGFPRIIVVEKCNTTSLAIFVYDHSPTREQCDSGLITCCGTDWLHFKLTYALSLHHQAKYRDLVVCGKRMTNDNGMTGAPSTTARIYSNDRNCHSSLDPSTRRSFKLSSYFTSFCLSRLVQFNVSTFSSVLIQNSSYKTRNGLRTNREPS